MGGGHGGSTTYKGLNLHHPKRWHVVTGKGLCAVMWFWVLYRAKQDGPVVLVRSSTSFQLYLVGDTLGRAMMTTLTAMETNIRLENWNLERLIGKKGNKWVDESPARAD
ncbi:hypothetical protein DITRI_Ditri03aG0223800 [Diplodiscus trichospermus]